MFNHISNGLVEKMVDDLRSSFFSPNIIIGESIGISIPELNKVHDIYAQFISDKKIKGMTQNLSQSFTNGSLIRLYTLNTFSFLIPLV